jgi:hypothetical protein
VQTSEETLEKYFGTVRIELTQKVQGLEALRVKVDKALLENLPSLIKTQIEGVLKERITELKGAVNSLKDVKGYTLVVSRQ